MCEYPPPLSDSLLSSPVSYHSNPVWEESRNPVSGRPPDPHKEWVFLMAFFVNVHVLCWRAFFFLLVLHAMRDDSEKVPALLTDYILKGNHSSRHLIMSREYRDQSVGPNRNGSDQIWERTHDFLGLCWPLPSLSLACAALSRAALVWEQWEARGLWGALTRILPHLQPSNPSLSLSPSPALL